MEIPPPPPHGTSVMVDLADGRRATVFPDNLMRDEAGNEFLVAFPAPEWAGDPRVGGFDYGDLVRVARTPETEANRTSGLVGVIEGVTWSNRDKTAVAAYHLHPPNRPPAGASADITTGVRVPPELLARVADDQ